MSQMPNNLNQMIAESGKSKAQVAAEKGLTPETLSRHIHSKIQITLKDAKNTQKFAAVVFIKYFLQQTQYP